MNDNNDDYTVSLLIPVYNEEATITRFYEEVSRVTEPVGEHLEFVFINDGSSDNSVGIIRELIKRDSRVALINFSRNFGKESAMVIIDKIPFPQMTIDLKAERKYCETHRNVTGKYDIFQMVDMPRAIIDLKQGVGRLIRKENDVGVTVICSPALTDGGRKQYRDEILESLPPMYFDSDTGVIPEFWAWHKKHAASGGSAQVYYSGGNSG